ncbi:MAG TPA: response regulator [Bryobacteraceae bacterium]|jgi:CheY-like chemotaxis protein
MGEPGAIFLAEDSPADVYLFREALKAHGIEHELLVFDDGETAMSFLLQAEHSGPMLKLFVLDLNLPKIDGEAILKHLRDTQRFAQSRVAILTSSDNPDDRDAATRHGADCYIRKPSSIAEFLDIGRLIKSMLAE